MTAITEVEWGECLVAPVRDAALEREGRKAYGVPYPVVQYFARCPWLARGLIDGRLRSGFLAHLDPEHGAQPGDDDQEVRHHDQGRPANRQRR